MKNGKIYMGFRIPKVWQILKRLAGDFRQAKTSYFSRKNLFSFQGTEDQIQFSYTNREKNVTTIFENVQVKL